MSSTTQFLRRHWLTLLVLTASVAVVNRVVVSQRAPGSMSVVEAQSMDMSAMKPPVGTTPVSVELVSEQVIADGPSYPAQVVSYDDQDIVARIPGLVAKVLAYPGDHVHAGQLLATLSAGEYDADLSYKSLEASAMRAAIDIAEKDVTHHYHLREEALAKAKMAETEVGKVQDDLAGAKLEVDKANSAVRGLREKLNEQSAALQFQEREYARQKKLFDGKVISLSELQESERAYKTALAAYRGSEQDIKAMEAGVAIAEKKHSALEKQVSQAINARTASRAALGLVEEEILQVKENVRIAKLRAEASAAQASAAASFSNYKELRALSDGVVSERIISPGTAVMAGQVILKVKTVSMVRVQAELPAVAAQKVKVGSPLRIMAGDQTFEARVSAVSPIANAVSRTVRIESIVAPSDAQIVPGTLVRVQLLADPATKKLALPLSAVQTSQDGAAFVWAVRDQGNAEVQSDWTCPMHPQVSEPGPGHCPICGMTLIRRKVSSQHKVERVPVSVGKTDGQYVELFAGVAAGDRVVTKGASGLMDGALVRLTESSVASNQKEAQKPKEPPKSNAKAPQPKASKPQPKPKAKENAQLWTCPMHPEVVQSSPGNCPKCGMKLVKKDAAKN